MRETQLMGERVTLRAREPGRALRDEDRQRQSKPWAGRLCRCGPGAGPAADLHTAPPRTCARAHGRLQGLPATWGDPQLSKYICTNGGKCVKSIHV